MMNKPQVLAEKIKEIEQENDMQDLVCDIFERVLKYYNSSTRRSAREEKLMAVIEALAHALEYCQIVHPGWRIAQANMTRGEYVLFSLRYAVSILRDYY